MFFFSIWLSGSALAQSPNLDTREGSLPLVIVAGHGGTQALEGAELRNAEKTDDPHFVLFRDVETNELAEAIAARVTALSQGESVTLIRSLVHRKYADLNRTLELSSHDAKGREFHREFHQAIDREVARLQAIHGWVLLLDIHGQTKYPFDLLIGTAKNQVVSQWSVEKLWGPDGLVASLTRGGAFTVDPPTANGQQRYAGGYTIRHHGDDPHIEAWQLEHRGDIRRDPELRTRYVDALTEVLVRALAQPPKTAPSQQS